MMVTPEPSHRIDEETANMPRNHRGAGAARAASLDGEARPAIRQAATAWLALACFAALPAPLAPRAVAEGEPAEGLLPATRLPPVEYVLQKLEGHRVVLLGEAHWIRHDAELVASLVPHLAEARVVLAMETLEAPDQDAIDRLLAAPEWDDAASMRPLRAAAWPYREYQDILRAAWAASRRGPGPMRVLAIGPPSDWREKGIDYEKFMADRVAAAVDSGSRVLVYCGLHHAFTRYQQPELDLAGRAKAFVDRAGNILRRRLGEQVFLVTLHKPVWCGKEPWDYCLPLDGAIDCAAVALGPVGFDVAGTPVGERTVDPGVYYAHGYPSLRLGEMTDGYVWSRPIEQYEDVRLIPLDEFAPDGAALREVAANNPFSDEAQMTREQLARLWTAEESKRRDALTRRRWKHLVGWRARCSGVGP
jgi:hypothetical protein